MAKRRLMQALGGISLSDDTPNDTARLLGQLTVFCETCLKQGLGKEAVELFKEIGMDERLLPLYETLRAAQTPGRSLSHLSPEVRFPDEEILSLLLEGKAPKKADLGPEATS